MADNVAITAGVGTAIAADDVSSVFYQRVKIARGTDGIAKGDAGTLGATTSLLSTELNSLATSTTAGIASAEVDLTTEGADDIMVLATAQMTTSGSPTGTIDIYALASLDGTTYSGDTGYSGTGAAYSLGAAGSQNLRWLGSIKAHANTATYSDAYSLKAAFGMLPPYFAIVVLNNTGIALHTSGSKVEYRTRY